MRIRSPLLIVPVALLVVAGACSNQGEGQPCDHDAGGDSAGTDDCESPLICVIGPNPADGTNSYRCCPPDLSQATTLECMVASAGIDASPLPPTDAATTETAAPAEGGGDAPGEAAPPADAPGADAPTDASEAGRMDGAPADGSPADGGAG
jgi:hypothetical protein